MAVVTTWKKTNYVGKYRQVMMKMTYGNGDTSVACSTGLKIIYGVAHSAPSVATKVVTGCAVSGGTVTLTVTDPLAACYLFLVAYGL